MFPVPINPGPVGARLRQYWRNWTGIAADEWVVCTLRHGYTLPFGNVLPPLAMTLDFPDAYCKTGNFRDSFILANLAFIGH